VDGVNGAASAPVLVALPLGDSSRTAGAAWLGNYVSGGNASFGLVLSCADDNGAFHDPRLLASLGTASGDLAAAADSAGVVHAVAVQTVDQDGRLLYFQGRCPPRFLASSVVNAASQQAPGVIPGSLATLYGAQLGPVTGASVGVLDSKTGLVTSSAGGVTVTFDGAPAPLFYIRRDQLSFQIPVEIASQLSSQLVVEFDGVPSLPVQVSVADLGPSFFTLNSSGSGSVVAVNEDGRLNGADAAAANNSVVVLYLTGHGLTSPALRTGEPAPSIPPFPQPNLPLKISIDGKPAEVLFVGAAPGFAGLLQLNARVPSDASSGPVEIRASMGNFTSRGGTTLSVR
jgi:uncharacterized protein (TIGR03437 family)